MAKEKGQKGSEVGSLIFTLLIMFCGVALIVMCIWIRTGDPIAVHLGPLLDDEVWTAGDQLQMSISAIDVSTLIAGLEGSLIVFFMILACIGVTGSKYSAECYIGTYTLCLLATIGFSIAFFANGTPNHWREDVEKVFTHLLEYQYEGPTSINEGGFTEAFNKFQNGEECCGIHGKVDYEGPTRLNLTAWSNSSSVIPVSCSGTTPEGCLDKLLSRATLYFALTAGISLGSILIEIPALLNALCQCSSV